jgi:hypothetical protein
VKALVLAAVLLVAGCSSDPACSLVGCTSRAELRVHGLDPSLRYPLTAHACFDTRCADVTIQHDPPAAGGPMSVPCPGQGRHSCLDLRSTQGYVGIAFDEPPAGGRARQAGVVVRDAGGAVVLRSSQPLRLVELAPNGERCGPICWSGTANFD